MSSEEAKQFYLNAYQHTVQNMQATEEDYAQYFSKDFVMHMNGKRFNYDEFVQLMLSIESGSNSVEIDFKEMISENNKVATVHQTHVSKKNGEQLYLDVLSFFEIKNHKFISGYELTNLRNS